MIIATTIAEARRYRLLHERRSWGLVPTMGFLHEAHLSLVRRARVECDRVAVSVFVNPQQFNDTGDFEAYPRDAERDLELLRAEGVDLVFAPEPEAMYPAGFQTFVTVGSLAEPLEGASRPGHFRGVATVVAKLFCVLAPYRAYFGQKDAQQLAVIKRLAVDLDFDLAVIGCPTVREADGLAMSSRNVRLTPEQRAAAPVLFRALQAAERVYAEGERSGEALREILRRTAEAEPLARIDYVSVADPGTLEELESVEGTALASLAVFFGEVRLIDNLFLDEGAGP